MRNLFNHAVCLLIGIGSYPIVSKAFAANEMSMAASKLNGGADKYLQIAANSSSPTRHLSYDEVIWARDSAGNNAAKISKVELVLTKTSTDKNQIRPYFYIEYDFDNTFKGGTFGGYQAVYLDLINSRGDVLFKDFIKLDIPRSKCSKERVRKEGYAEFDWEHQDIKGIDIRTSLVIGSQHGCYTNPR
jgi:hypothetical protein